MKLKNVGLKIKKVVGVCLVVAMIIGVGTSDALAATKTKSWLSSDSKTLYRATLTSSEANSRKIPLTAWQEKPKGVSITLSVTTGVEHSMSASSSFSGKGSVKLVELGGELGFSVSGSVSFTAEYSYTVDKNNAVGDYRAVLVWPGARLHGVVTSEPNGDGNHQIMDENSSKLPPRKKVINDEVINYGPTLTNMKVRLEHRK